MQAPWILFPNQGPNNIFWRQEGEKWALTIWLPFWSQLSSDEKKTYLSEHQAPDEWQDFYDERFQDFIACEDGPGGWVLRNNLTPCDEGLLRYTSVVDIKKPMSYWWWYAGLIAIGFALGWLKRFFVS